MDAWSGWTPESVQLASELWAGGKLSARDIGEIVGCTANTIIGKMRRMNVAGGSGVNRPPSNRPYRPAVFNAPSPVDAAVLQPKPEPKPPQYAWPPERIETLRRLFAEGISQEGIADELHCTRKTVRGKVMLLGLVRDRPEPAQRPKKSDGRAEGRALKGPTGDLREDDRDTGSRAERGKRNPPVKCRVSGNAGGVNPHSLTASHTENLGRLVAESVLKPGPSETTPVTFFALEKRMCRWPVSDGYYCGAPCDFRESLYHHHADIGTQERYRRPRGRNGERLPIGGNVTAFLLRSV